MAIFATHDQGETKTARFFWKEHTPHWKRVGDGWAEMEVQAHKMAGWVSLDACEVLSGGEGKRDSMKRVMLTLGAAEALWLRDFLNEVLVDNRPPLAAQLGGTGPTLSDL